MQINIILAIPGALIHGISQGIIQGVSGGNAEQSFVTAAISSLAGSGFSMTGSLGRSIPGQSLFGAVMGGAVSNMQGGNFWEGAAIGLTVGLLNHAGKKLYPAIDGWLNPNRNINIEVTNNVTGEVTISSQGKKYVTPTYEMNVTGTDPEGNNIAETFDVVRFGVKNGKVQTLKAGNYTVRQFYKMYGYLAAFRVNGPYAIHMLSANRIDANWGCLAIKGGFPEWNRFVETLDTISGRGLYDLGSSGTMNVNIQYVKMPNVYIKK